MVATQDTFTPDTEQLQENFAKLDELIKRLNTCMLQSEGQPKLPLPDHEFYGRVFSAYMMDMMNHPSRLIESQIGAWKDTVEFWSGQMSQNTPDGEQRKTADRRFSDPAWDEFPAFTVIKQQYLDMSKRITDSVANIEGLDASDQNRASFFTQLMLDHFSPSNYLATNPVALKKAVQTNGASLVEGLENFVKDVERNKGRLAVSLVDTDAFEVGKNLATTPGEIVFQNRLFQLIQYTPTTDKVRPIPLLIFPPWINKYYILDLKPQNSLIKYAVDQGFQVFVVSWVNPDSSYRDTGFEDYVFEGGLTAIREVQRISEQPRINTVGYCIGGTMLSCTLSWLKKNGLDPVKSATFFTTLTDFDDPGDIGVFIDDNTVKALEAAADEKGIIDAFYMGQVFSFPAGQ